MTAANRIEFIAADAPVREPVTKFGGQPHWIGPPQWPLSRQTGRPMQFIAQITLKPPLFSGVAGRMAYVFMTDDDDEYVDSTWEPEGGENAVVIQPGLYAGPVEALAEGPTLYRLVARPGEHRLERQPAEFRVREKPAVEPEYAPLTERDDWSDAQAEEYAAALKGNKIGGSPLFVQGDEFPPDEVWRLLLQLDSAAVPFFVNIGDAGVAYAFIDAHEREGKFLWQCA